MCKTLRPIVNVSQARRYQRRLLQMLVLMLPKIIFSFQSHQRQRRPASMPTPM